MKPSGVTVGPDEQIIVETPGSGGFGPPAERAWSAVQEDRLSGKFSDEYIVRHYSEVSAAASG